VRVGARGRAGGPVSARLRVDWPGCDGHGLCAELLPEVIGRDEWGYPLLAPQVPEPLLPLARQAVRACPTLALRLLE
jgi:ferredoxin